MKERLVITKFFTQEDFDGFLSNCGIDSNLSFGIIKSLYFTCKDDVLTLSKVKNFKQERELGKQSPDTEYKEHWTGIYDFRSHGAEYCLINCYFNSDISNEALQKIFVQPFTSKTKSIYYPKQDKNEFRLERYVSDRNQPRYPIYIVSKGRAGNCFTADYLVKMDVPFYLVVEECDREEYTKYFGAERILILDPQYQEDYDSYDNLGLTKSKGPGPARNFAWDHAISLGAKWHWVLDDNMKGFYLYNDNERVLSADGGVIAALEDFIDRYENVAISGMDYHNFVIPNTKLKPYIENTKIYSCLFIRNDIPFRWAGRYNEDTDICLRVMKEGYSTLLFEAFCVNKMATQTVAGGNTAVFYANEGTLPKSKMLYLTHPDVSKISWKFSRWHHEVNYSQFKRNKNYTIQKVLFEMSKPSALSIKDKAIIKEIYNIDFSKEINYDELLNDLKLSVIKRKTVVESFKYLTYLRDPKEILKRMLKPPVLVINDLMFLDDGTEDERIAKVLLDLFPGKINRMHDLHKELDFVQDPKKINRIQKELIVNKYIRKDNFKSFKYNFRRVKLTEDEHKFKHDSLKYIQKTYLGMDIQDCDIPITSTDKKIRGIGVQKKRQEKFKSNITLRGDTSLDEKGNMICITGDEGFSDKDLCFAEIDRILKESNTDYDGIINGVTNEADQFVADYALVNKIRYYEFVPNFNLYGDSAIDENLKLMSKNCIAGIIFVKDCTSYYSRLAEYIDNCHVIEYGKKSTDLDEIFS